MDKILAEEQKIIRHSKTVRWVHWLVALSTFALIFSGFGQMPMYARYGITDLPGLGWSSNYHLTLSIHYLAGLILTFALVYHLVYHGLRRDTGILPRKGDVHESAQIIKAMFGFGHEPENDKFLAEQRLAYVFIGLNLVLITLTGVFKALKNYVDYPFSQSTMVLNTNLHTLAAILIVLGIVAHLGAFVFGENRKLLMSIFHGKVDLHYAKERHSRWYQRLARGQNTGKNIQG